MNTQNATRDMNQSLLRIENHYFNNESQYNTLTITERWNLYSDIFQQLNLLQKLPYFHELEYRIVMEGENINRVLLDIINEDDDLYLLFYPSNCLLEEYADIDDIKIFL